MGEISFQQKQPQNLRPSSEKFKGYNFVPTNFLEWRQYNAPKIFAVFFSIVLAFLALVLLYTIISYLAPHIEYDSYHSEWEVEDPLDLAFGYAWYSDLDKALDNYHGDLVPFFIVPLIFIAIFLPPMILCIRKIPQPVPNPTPLKDFADYVQKGYYARVYSFFLKEGKLGLLNSKTLTAQLNPVYDKLKWKEQQRFIEAEKDGVSFVMDINGNILK